MRSGKQSRLTSIAAPKPIVVDVLNLRNLRPAWEHQFILDIVLGIPRPERMNDEANATVRWEAAQERW